MPDGLHVLRGDAARFRAHEGVGAGDHERVPMLLAYAAHIEQRDGPVEQHLIQFGIAPVDAENKRKDVIRRRDARHDGTRRIFKRERNDGHQPGRVYPSTVLFPS